MEGNIEKMKNENEARISELEKRVHSCISKHDECNAKVTVSEEVKKSVEKDAEEAALIRTKENNLIYFGIPELTNNSTPADRMNHDYNLLNEAYSKKLVKTDIASMFRVGKINEQVPRPLIIKYTSAEIKSKYLRTSFDLKIKHCNEIKKIYASIDRTEKQREKHRKLVSELKKRKEEGEENIVIRDGKIIQSFPKDKVAQRVTWASLLQA